MLARRLCASENVIDPDAIRAELGLSHQDGWKETFQQVYEVLWDRLRGSVERQRTTVLAVPAIRGWQRRQIGRVAGAAPLHYLYLDGPVELSKAGACGAWDGIPFDRQTGQQPNERDTPPERTPHGEFVLYHGTSPHGAEQIISGRRLHPDDLNVVGFSTTASQAQSFAAMKHGPVLRITVPPDELGRFRVSREIGGSGRNQFLIGPKERFGRWDGVKLNAAEIYDPPDRPPAPRAVVPVDAVEDMFDGWKLLRERIADAYDRDYDTYARDALLPEHRSVCVLDRQGADHLQRIVFR